MKTFRSPLRCFAFKNRKGEVTDHFCLEFMKWISGYKMNKVCLGAVAAYSQTASIASLKMCLVYILYLVYNSNALSICADLQYEILCVPEMVPQWLFPWDRGPILQVVCLLLWNFPLQNCIQSLPGGGRGEIKVSHRIIPDVIPYILSCLLFLILALVPLESNYMPRDEFCFPYFWCALLWVLCVYCIGTAG